VLGSILYFTRGFPSGYYLSRFQRSESHLSNHSHIHLKTAVKDRPASIIVRDAGDSQLQQMLAQNTPLQTADAESLAVAQCGDVSPARHRAHPPQHLQVGERAAAEAHEPALIEPRFEVFQSIGDDVSLVPGRRQPQDFASATIESISLTGTMTISSFCRSGMRSRIGGRVPLIV
jgi:hypothetical protein